MSEVGVEIVKTEESEENRIKYLNINASDSEVERNPDIVRLCADAGILEYVKSKTGHWIWKDFDDDTGISKSYWCSKCNMPLTGLAMNYCGICGAKMESEDK